MFVSSLLKNFTFNLRFYPGYDDLLDSEDIYLELFEWLFLIREVNKNPVRELLTSTNSELLSVRSFAKSFKFYNRGVLAGLYLFRALLNFYALTRNIVLSLEVHITSNLLGTLKRL